MRKLWKIVICLVMVISGFTFPGLYAEKDSNQVLRNLYQEKLQVSDEIFLDSLEELSFYNENIALNREGFSHQVYSLQKNGNRWVALIDDNTGYCPRGHLRCGGCKMCHKSDCWYYVRPCKLWD